MPSCWRHGGATNEYWQGWRQLISQGESTTEENPPSNVFDAAYSAVKLWMAADSALSEILLEAMQQVEAQAESNAVPMDTSTIEKKLLEWIENDHAKTQAEVLTYYRLYYKSDSYVEASDIDVWYYPYGQWDEATKEAASLTSWSISWCLTMLY